VESNLPSYTARLTFVAGRDENRLLIVDERYERAAETTWRPTTYETPGPAQWDYQLQRVLLRVPMASRQRRRCRLHLPC
jgi:hypothetical protein